ncbi:cystathionine beta-lyase [Sphingobium sufflavum]|uniref:cystathionine beta-lyase n=1 Tax=Sphingobium sufflavum TaxID=1129547 RepID=UPI001F20841D|nr:cystathionine beta-lyase [Sphingobium sufflavum]MCE7795329.1 cystathionine beta-lyase [Sphingobium sufflavum]
MSSADEKDGGPLSPATRLVGAGRKPEWTRMPDRPGAIVSPPVWRASTILFDDVAHLRRAGQNTHEAFYYGRRGTPTTWALADALTGLEPEAAGTMLYPSGVAAIAGALLAILKPGDQILMVDSAYDPSRSMCNGLLADFGVEVVYYDPLAGAGIADLITDRTAAIFLESPGSLTFEVQDIPAIVAVARARGIVTLIDNTWATPLYLPAMALGVDISIMACTKYIVGHSDVMMGSVTANARWWPRIRARAYGLGQVVSPDDAALTLRGLRTLSVRLERHRTSALAVAQWLAARPEVAGVLHPALPSCPGHAEWARDFKGSSGLFSFHLAGGGEAERAAFIDALALFGIGYSWGGFESLALPVDPEKHRTARPWTAAGPLVRLHIGLEEPDDLIADLERGLAVWRDAMAG